MRPHPLLMATVTAALLLGGCSDDDKSEPTGKTSASASARPSDAPAPPYAATLVAGDQGATLTNTGAKNDRYVMQVVPSVLGAATPPVVELKPGASAEVTYQLTSQGTGDTVPTLVAHSTTTGEDVRLELSD